MALQLSGSLDVSGSITAETISLTSGGTIAGTASWAEYVVNGGGGGSNFATTGSNVFEGNQTIDGNLLMSGSFRLVYNDDPNTNMLFGQFDGSNIHGPYYQLFGNQYPNASQRGGAEFVYDTRNGGESGFGIASYDGSSWTRRFRVDDSGSTVTGSVRVSDTVTANVIKVSSNTPIAGTASWALNVVNPIGGASSNQFFYTSSQAPSSASLETYLYSPGLMYLESQSISITGSGTTFIGDSGPETLIYWQVAYVFDDVNSKWWVISIDQFYSDDLLTLYSVQDLDNYRANGDYTQQYTDFPGTTGYYKWYIVKNFAEGFQSTAIGRESLASGDFSIVLGGMSKAEGNESIAIGHTAAAYGTRSVAISSGYEYDNSGFTSLASGSYSIVLGRGTSLGERSTAMSTGYAAGIGSTAIAGTTGFIGVQIIDPDPNPVQMNIVNGVLSIPNSVDYSRIKFGSEYDFLGYGTMIYSYRAGFSPNGTLYFATKLVPYCSTSFDGTNFNVYLGSINNSGSYNFMTDYNDSGLAFSDIAYASVDFNTGLDDKCYAGTAAMSFGEGYAFGSYSTNLSYGGISTGFASLTEGGSFNWAAGQYSHAKGYSSIALGDASHVDGYQSFAIGDFSKAEGSINFTSAQFANIIEINTDNEDEKKQTIKISDTSKFEVGDMFAYVVSSITTNNLSTVTGYIVGKDSQYITCSQQTAFPIPYPQPLGGNLPQPNPEFVNWPLSVSGSIFNLRSLPTYSIYLPGPSDPGATSTFYSGSTFSKAEGFYTLAANFAAHAEGSRNAALGKYSHAEGYYNVAYGEGAHAEGYCTVASGAYQHVQGQFNVSSSAQSAFIIGNGTDDSNRSNLVFASGSQFQVTGSVSISSMLTLATTHPLPASAPTGSIMSSGSNADNKPYYWNGATWTALF